MEEESFPRGGVSHGQTPKRKRKSKEERDLFQTKSDEPKAKRPSKTQSGNKLGWKDKTKERKAKRQAAVLQQLSQPRGIACVELLSKQAISPDMLVLGCVKEIKDYELTLSLPNGHTGSVQLTNISDAYTELLQRLTAGDTAADEELYSLSELFHIGQLLRCRVLEVEQQQSGKRHIKLSANPRDLNHNFSSSSLKTGLVLSGCVSSIEDHGYVVDLGIKGVNAFLKTQAAEEWNKGEALKTGQYVQCMVETHGGSAGKAGGTRVVSLSVQPAKTCKAVVTEEMGVTLNTLLPGMLLQGHISKKTDDGIEVKYLKYQGGVHRTHLEQSPRNYDVQSEIKVCVLYIHPSSKVVALTQLPHLVTPDLAPKKLFGDLGIGDIIEEVTVRFADQNKGVFLNLGDRITGFAKLSDVSDEKPASLQSQYGKGTKQRCRVLRLDYMDRVVQVSLKKSVLEQQFLKYADIEPGMAVQCEVRGMHTKGVSVKLTAHIHGFIPTMHLADIPLKHPEKRFQIGDKLKCRVLRVNPEEHRLILTKKRSLVTSKLPVLTEYSQCTTGETREGFVAQIKSTGVLVVFYNDVKGWVPKGELSTENIDYPEKVFYPGQVVKCRILKFSPEEEKLLLSLKLSGKASFGTKQTDVPEDYQVGKLTDCRVLDVTNKGLDVRLLPSKMAAFLPKMHLSDHQGNSELLLETYKKGDVLRDAMYTGSSQVISLTKKASLISAGREDNLVTDFSELKPGILLPGVVKKIMSYGVFLDMLNGLVGLVPNKYLSDRKVNDPMTLYSEGQTLMAKVIEVDEDKKRFLLSVRGSDCYHGDTAVGLDLLEDYLTEYWSVLTALREQKGKKGRLAEVKVGTVVQATVTEVTKHGILCQVPNKMKGFTTQDNMIGVVCRVGQEVEAVVLCVDPQSACLELSLDNNLIKAVKNFKDNKFSKAKEGQVVKSEVHLIKPEFILVNLKGHASGRFAYLPAKRHLSDLFGSNNYCIGQINNIVIKRVVDEQVLASLEIHEVEMEKSQAASQQKEGAGKAVKKHGLKLGMVVKAVIKKVHQHQMNITVDGVPGRVHITEVVDVVTAGSNPLESYKTEDEITVKIIGFREVSSQGYLPISSVKISTALPECTLKPSKLATKGLQKGEEVQGQQFKVGDKVNAFVTGHHFRCIWVDLSPVVKGKIYFLNGSEDLEELHSPGTHFKEGYGYEATVVDKGKGGVPELSFTGKPPIIKKGAIVKAYVLYVDPGHGLSLQLGQGYKGHVALTDLADSYQDNITERFKVDQVVRCCVLKCDKKDKEKCTLSLRPSKCGVKQQKVQDKEYVLGTLTEGQTLRGYVANCNKLGVFVSITRDVTARVQFSHASTYYLSDPEVVFYPGTLVTAKIMGINHPEKSVTLSLLEKHTGQPENVPTELTTGKRQTKKTNPPARKRKSSVGETEEEKSPNRKRKSSIGEEEQSPRRKRKSSMGENEGTPEERKKKKKKKEKKQTEDEEVDSGIEASRESDSDFEPQGIATKQVTSQSGARLSLSAGFTWDGSFSLPATPGGVQESDSDESDGETDQGKPKKTRQEKQEERRQEEKRLFETEKQLVEGGQVPQAAEDFDRLVLQSPDSSMVWLRYMAFHLETTEIEKARAVAERALKTISFREEQEKLNVWVAYLNLENMFGTPESLKEVYNKAVQHNEPIKVAQQLINIFIKSEKMEAAEQQYQTMVKKHSLQKEVWVQFGLFYFKQDKPDLARKVMQRSLKSLDKKDHVEVLSKFAQMEFKHGETERGKTMFESILGNYPKRNDLWSVYIDMVTKLGDLEPARALFERVIHLNMSAKKMKFFFKKYLDFEQKHGSEETVRSVKEKAVDYVESKANTS